MTKPKKLRDSRTDEEKELGPFVPTIEEHSVPAPKRYTPPNCSACTALRPKPEDSYVSVYHTRREDGHVIHYCKCAYCNNTFKDPQKI